MSHAATVTTIDQPSIRAQYDRDGYLALNNITSAEEVARIRALLDTLYARFDSLGDRAIELSGAHRSGTPLRSPEINDTATLAPYHEHVVHRNEALVRRARLDRNERVGHVWQVTRSRSRTCPRQWARFPRRDDHRVR